MNDKEMCVLIAIQPQWVIKILMGEKVVEVRKSMPKLITPFKCYIYMTAGDYHYRRDGWATAVFPPSGGIYDGAKMVVAEFVCDRIDTIVVGDTLKEHKDILDQSCLTEQQLQEYLNGKVGYGWHISELKVYEEPKPITSFAKPCDMNCTAICEYGCPMLKRPPQSWCYVQDADINIGKWICSDPDSMQYVRKVNNTTWDLIECRETSTGYAVCSTDVDLRDYSSDEINDYISGYYAGGIDEMNSIYGNASSQICAECIFEQTEAWDMEYYAQFTTFEEAKIAIEKRFGGKI